MDLALLQRLLAPAHLAAPIARRLALPPQAMLAAATPREIDAPGYLSDLVGVDLQWPGAAEAPRRAVLKVSHAGHGQPELPFYERIATAMNSPFVPRFYAGGVDEATGRTWLLIEDLSDSHQRPSQAPLPPTFGRCTAIAQALAHLHAAGRTSTATPDMGPSLWDRLHTCAWQQDACDHLWTQAGDALDASTRALYAQWLRAYPTLVQQAEDQWLPQRTLIHGDAQVWNWLLPREGAPGGATPKLIDWDAWHLGAGVWDLAYMMATHWDRGVRQRFETPLLDIYHEALLAAGVAGYTREALQQDYRLAVLLHLRTPMARFARGMSAHVWWPQLVRVVQAVEDWRDVGLMKAPKG